MIKFNHTGAKQLSKHVKLLAVGVLSVAATSTAIATSAPLTFASTPDPAVWVGSPVQGTWPNSVGCPATYPSAKCSLPSVHHIAFSTTFDWGTTKSDWAADLQSVPEGRRVVLYAAPQNAGYEVQAHVDKVKAACASGVIKDGGYQVQIGLYVNGLKIGSVTYAHIQPSVSEGQWISRWGTQVGTVGSYKKSTCWAGTHVHVELSSRKNYACYSNVFQGKAWGISEANFVGFVGGGYASGARKPCP